MLSYAFSTYYVCVSVSLSACINYSITVLYFQLLNFFSHQLSSINKAINSSETPVKEKHARSILWIVLMQSVFYKLLWSLSFI